MPFKRFKTLRLRWSKVEKDYNISYPKKSHGWLMFELIQLMEEKDIIKQLEKFGYDTKTLKISCDLKVEFDE